MQQPPKRRTPWLLIIGGIVGLISLVLCGVGGFSTVSEIQSLSNEPKRTGDYSLELEKGESTSAWSQTSGADCTVTGPSGPVDIETSAATQEVDWGDGPYYLAATVAAPESGSYTFNCSDEYVVGQGFSIGGLFAAIGGGALCCLAVVLMVIGLVIWLVRRKN